MWPTSGHDQQGLSAGVLFQSMTHDVLSCCFLQYWCDWCTQTIFNPSSTSTAVIVHAAFAVMKSVLSGHDTRLKQACIMLVLFRASSSWPQAGP